MAMATFCHGMRLRVCEGMEGAGTGAAYHHDHDGAVAEREEEAACHRELSHVDEASCRIVNGALAGSVSVVGGLDENGGPNSERDAD